MYEKGGLERDRLSIYLEQSLQKTLQNTVGRGNTTDKREKCELSSVVQLAGCGSNQHTNQYNVKVLMDLAISF